MTEPTSGAPDCTHGSGPAHVGAHDQMGAAVRQLDTELDELIQRWTGAESRNLVPRETAVIALARSIAANWTHGYTAELLAAAITRIVPMETGDRR